MAYAGDESACEGGDFSVFLKKSIKLLQTNPTHPSLRMHKLQGKMKQFYSVSIDMKYRVVVDFIVVDKTIIMIDIGSHDDVY